jgi:serine/threonine protein kinase
MQCTSQKDLGSFNMQSIPAAHIWPPYSDGLTMAPDSALPEDCFIKRPSLLSYDEDKATRIPDLVLAEARICEILRKNPHPNVAQYGGCLVRDNHIIGLCFAKYDITLSEKLNCRHKLSHSILRGIENGIKHLHTLGINHNDINPTNIMFKNGDENPVIIDFDSCGREGEMLVKAGTMDWSDDKFDFASPENDYFGLKKIEEAISKVQEGN